ncbi:MAG TPA: hypothetical protein ENH97_00065 [bacterium]|nr:hypothetical protein [bacterium]
MPKKLFKICSILTIGIIIGFIVGLLFPRSNSYVQVTLKNISDQDITDVRLVHEHGICLVENLKRDQSSTIKFIAGGETSYTLYVKFQDGRVINIDDRYAESGYKITETIGNQEIKPDFEVSY